jgi:hypothetical protein
MLLIIRVIKQIHVRPVSIEVLFIVIDGNGVRKPQKTDQFVRGGKVSLRLPTMIAAA